MGLYSSRVNNSYSDAVAIDLNTVEESKYDSFDEAAIMAVVESEQNYNKLMKAVGVEELNYLEANGTDMVYTEANVSGFFAKAKEFFKRVIAKVASVLKSFFAKIDSFTKSDKDFLNKYRKDLTGLNLKDMKVNGYTFTLDEPSLTKAAADKAVSGALGVADPASVSSADDAACDAVIGKDENDAIEDMLETYRGTAIGTSTKYEAGEYSKELYEHFRNGESAKEEIDVDIVAQMQILATAADVKKKAEKTFRDQEKLINDFIKELEKAEKNLVNSKETSAAAQTTQGKRVRAVNVVIKAYKAVTGVNTTVFGAYLQALKDQSRQAKAICVKALTYRAPKNESGVEYGTTGSFLENVDFN